MPKTVKHRRNEEAIAIVATNIRKYRTEQKLTIAELANQVGVDYSQIGRMERGVVNPNVSIIFDIARVLRVPAHKLLEPPTK